MRMLLFTLFLAAQSAFPTQKYSPGRNADSDIRNAIVEAQTTDRRILLEVGGEWCSWCHVLDRFFRDHPAVAASRDRNYVTVKINVSPENQNKKVLARYPQIPGYPHFFVLEADGTLLHSQRSFVLEDGPSYHVGKFSAFLEQWAPPSRRARP